MRKEIIETGKSVDSAIDSACEKLGCSRDDCEWEIIDLPKKSFLGLKNTPAKVRVSVEVPEEKPRKQEKPIQIEESKPKQQAAQFSQERPRREKKENIAAPRTTEKAEQLKSGDISEKEILARDYIADMISAAGLKADYVITHEHGGTCITIVGEGLGMVIGRRGETLDAIQYLAGLVANRGEGDYLRLTVDCGDYRLKRKDTLEGLAKKLASQVIKTNVSKTLEPMNPFERRVIHATVSEIDGVSSFSIGDEPNRRVVITSPTAKSASKGGFRGGEGPRGGYERSRGPRRDLRPDSGDRKPPRERERRGERDEHRSKPAQSIQQGPPKQTPESEVTSGISFGKIDL